MIIFLSVSLFIAVVLIVIFIRRILTLFNKCEDLKLELAQKEFTNKWARDAYKELAVYLTNKKSRLSKESKLDVLRLYNNILLYIPHEFRELLKSSYEAVDFDKDVLALSEHKQAAIESLESLSEQDDINTKELIALNYHISYLLLR